jgi:prevent-host-death family protein
MPDDLEDRITNNDFGDAETVTTRELREKLSEIVGRCAYGGDRFVIKRHGKPLAAVVPIEDMFVAQLVEDQHDAEDWERMEASGELDGPGIPLDEVVKKHGP